MKVNHGDTIVRKSWIARMFRFWFPLFLFAYILYIEIILRSFPVSGPIAMMGYIVPVPLGYIEDVGIVWYRDALRIAHWSNSLSQTEKLNQENIRTWVGFRKNMEYFANEMGENSVMNDIPSMHMVVQKVAQKAKAQGVYQEFAQQRVEMIKSMIDVGIYFPDLAHQYSELPTREKYGTYDMKSGDIPEVYKEVIDKKEITLIETDTHYVFVKFVLQDSQYYQNRYRITELGIAKQNTRETIYAFLKNHPVTWF